DPCDPRRPANRVQTADLVVDLRHRLGRQTAAGRGLKERIAAKASGTIREEGVRMLRAAFAVVLLGALMGPAGAQNFPDRPIRLIVPYGTGGITDITARIVAPAIGDQLGQQIFVDNRAGGAGMFGFGATANATADGYTLVLATTALAANPILFK